MAAQRFATTGWSLVVAAGMPTAEARRALNELCAVYWSPLYMFVRHDRRGRSAADAADLTQEFFASIIERGDIADLDRARGRFRDWLLQAMRNFLANQSKRQSAQKRGDGKAPLSLDAEEAERLYLGEAADGLDPEKLYTRRWAMVAIERALGALRAELGDGDEQKARALEAVTGALLGEGAEGGGYQAAAAALGTTAGALRVAATRWRKQLRHEIAETLELGADVDAELEELIGSLA